MAQVLHNLLVIFFILAGVFFGILGVIVPLKYIIGIGLPIKGRKFRVLYLIVSSFCIISALELSFPSLFWVILFIVLICLIGLEYLVHIFFARL
jgi:hypothetical protein